MSCLTIFKDLKLKILGHFGNNSNKGGDRA